MSHTVWRIATDTPDFVADDRTGAGARKTGGRWNEAGVAMLYAADSRALACVETVVHLNSGGLPFNRYLVEVTIPDSLWAQARRETAASLPVGWDAEPAGRVSIKFGTDWIKSAISAVLLVPSVIIPEESNILINPDHPHSTDIALAKVRRWLYDPRFAYRLR